MSTTEGYTQVAANGAGDKIRDVAITVPVPAATPDLPDTPTRVKQQVVVLADVDGDPIDFAALAAAINDLTKAALELRDLIQLVTS